MRLGKVRVVQLLFGVAKQLEDFDDEPVVLFESEWAVDWVVQHNESLKLRFEGIHSK